MKPQSLPSTQSVPSMQVVKRGEKGAMLTQFILREIASGRVLLNGQWRVLALTLDSPVVAAVRSVIEGLDGAPELELRIVLAADQKKIASDHFGALKEVEVRAAHSVRILDAHEQLVLSETSSWTGDCMRRNPRERDAFETFGAADCQLAHWARLSFERIWAGALAIGSGHALARAGVLKEALDRHQIGKTTVLATSRN